MPARRSAAALLAALSCLVGSGCGAVETSASGGRPVPLRSAEEPPPAVEIRPALDLDLAADAIGTGAEPTDTAPAAPPPSPRTDPLPPRALEYLERGHRQIDRLERGIRNLGPARDAAGALAAAALARHGRVEAAEAARHAAKALAACAGRWHTMQCERASLPLQRLVLQFPDVLPEAPGRDLRRELAAPVPPPADPSEPWAFAPTENQRLLTMARALGAHAIAGSGASPPARAWITHAEAVLAARDAAGWYEEESAGYLGSSIESLLHLADFAPAPRVRELAGRQLHLLFARWAERQVGGMPAGARTRTYVHWALGDGNLPWRAWAWLFAGLGDPEEIAFRDWPALPLSGYRLPAPLERLLADRASFGTYEVRQRRAIDPGRRRPVDAAIYTWATPDYLLSSTMSVDGMALAVSGGEEVPVVLLPEGEDFVPLYLWSRAGAPRGERWKNRSDQEQAVAHRDVALARLGTGDEPGHAYLAPGWEAVEAVGDVVVARRGDTWVALSTDGGWQLAPAQERLPAFYGRDPNLRGARVAVPRRQPAALALEVGRAAVDGSFAAWKERMTAGRLEVARADSGEPVRLAYTAADGRRLVFVPGRSATVDGTPLDPRSWPRHASPFLAGGSGAWRFVLGDFERRFAPLAENRPTATADGEPPATGGGSR